MRKGVFAGSFDPITLGHIDVIRKALEVFDEVYVLCAVNPDKKYMFSPEEKVAMVRAAIRDAGFPENRVFADFWDGYTYEYCLRVGSSHIIKGIRSSADLEYENVLADETEKLCPDIKTVMTPADEKYKDLSSSAVREAIQKGEKLDSMLSPGVRQIIEEKLNDCMKTAD